MPDDLAPLLRTTRPAWSMLRAVGEITRRELAARGHGELRTAHISVCAQVLQGRTRLADIAARVMVTKQAVSLLVQELEDLGYLERSVDPDDRRARIVKLTRKGRKAAADALEVMKRINRVCLEAVGPERLSECERTLRDVERALSASALEPDS